MSEHPIEGLMRTAMDSIQDMVDVNTIIGEPIETSNDVMIVPISKVCFGFAAGGSEFNSETLDEYKRKEKEEEMQYKLPFGGGSGAGVSIKPVAFLIINKDNIKLMPIEYASTVDKMIDYIPELIEKITKKDNCFDEDEYVKKVKAKIKVTPEKYEEEKKENIKDNFNSDYLDDE